MFFREVLVMYVFIFINVVLDYNLFLSNFLEVLNIIYILGLYNICVLIWLENILLI